MPAFTIPSNKEEEGEWQGHAVNTGGFHVIHTGTGENFQAADQEEAEQNVKEHEGTGDEETSTEEPAQETSTEEPAQEAQRSDS